MSLLYLPLLCFLTLSFGISLIMSLLPRLRAPFRPNKEKCSPYECGERGFDGDLHTHFKENARTGVDVRFFLVAILFILFDVELAFLFPWAIALGALGWFGVFSMIVFLSVLGAGFIYEWKKGALEWE